MTASTLYFILTDGGAHFGIAVYMYTCMHAQTIERLFCHTVHQMYKFTISDIFQSPKPIEASFDFEHALDAEKSRPGQIGRLTSDLKSI